MMKTVSTGSAVIDKNDLIMSLRGAQSISEAFSHLTAEQLHSLKIRLDKQIAIAVERERLQPYVDSSRASEEKRWLADADKS